MQSVSVFLREGKFIIVTLHGSGGGDPCLEAGPVLVLPCEESATEIGHAIFSGLALTTWHHPWPSNPQEWKQLGAPLLISTGCRSWRAFSNQASNLRVDRIADTLQLLPSARDAKGAFLPLEQRNRTLDRPTAAELGRLVAAELEFAFKRDATSAPRAARDRQ